MSKLTQALLDVAGVVGAGLIAFGAWLIWPPVGFITAGALLLAGAILLSRGSPPPAPPPANGQGA